MRSYNQNTKFQNLNMEVMKKLQRNFNAHKTQ